MQINETAESVEACDEYAHAQSREEVVCAVHVAHLVQAVGQRGEALHMGQSQQTAEEAVEGGLVLPLLLELLSQLKQALPPPVQHPRTQPEPAPPPIRAPRRPRTDAPPLSPQR